MEINQKIVNSSKDVHSTVVTTTPIAVTIVARNTQKIILENVGVVLLPAMDYGIAAVLYGHEKMVIALDTGVIKCLSMSDTVLCEYTINSGLAYVDGVSCLIVVSDSLEKV